MLVKTFIRYTIAGALSYGVKAVTSYLFTEIFHFWYFYSYIISLLILVVFNFYMNLFFIFKTSNKKQEKFVKYILSLLAFSVADASLMKVLTDVFSIYYMYSIFISTVAVFLAKFFVYHFLIFKQEELTEV